MKVFEHIRFQSNIVQHVVSTSQAWGIHPDLQPISLCVGCACVVATLSISNIIKESQRTEICSFLIWLFEASEANDNLHE